MFHWDATWALGQECRLVQSIGYPEHQVYSPKQFGIHHFRTNPRVQPSKCGGRPQPSPALAQFLSAFQVEGA